MNCVLSINLTGASWICAEQEEGIPYQGFPSLGIVTQGILNPFLRKSLGMQVSHLNLLLLSTAWELTSIDQGKESGVLVNKVMYDNSSYGLIEPGDVLLEIDGTKIFNNQTVSLKLNPSSKHKYRFASHLPV